MWVRRYITLKWIHYLEMSQQALGGPEGEYQDLHLLSTTQQIQLQLPTKSISTITLSLSTHFISLSKRYHTMDLIVDFPQRDSNIIPLRYWTTIASRISNNFHQQKEKSVIFGNDVEYPIARITEDLRFPGHEIKSTKKRVVALILRSLNKEGMTLAQYAEWCVASGKDTSNFMGLEQHFSLETSRQIRLRRRQVVAAVMTEQRRQNDKGIYDPDQMACVSFDNRA